MHLSMIVDGQPIEAATGERSTIVNPANGSLVATVPCGGPIDATRAVTSAATAIETWRAASLQTRVDALARGLDAVAAAADSLAVLLTREQGKPLAEAATEIDTFIERMRSFLRLAPSTSDGAIPVFSRSGGGGARQLAAPTRGVAVSLVAWNFPIGLLTKKLGPTLLAGGVLIVKPAETTPLTTLRVVECLNQALPPGVLNCVTGRGDGLGAALVANAAVQCVFLTGSDATGLAVRKEAAGPRQQLSLELSGSDPMIVCADADLPKAARAAVVGRFRNAGQACVAVKRLYVAEDIYDAFVSELCELVRLREPGDGLTPAPAPRLRMGPLHLASERARIEEQVDDAVRKGAEFLVGGGRPADPDTQRGHFFNPTVMVNVAADSRLVTEEVFGPVLPVFKTQSLSEAITRANRQARDLNAYLWTRDVQHAQRVRSAITCRQLWVNRLSFESGLEA